MFDGALLKIAFKSLKEKFKNEKIKQIIVTLDKDGELDFKIVINENEAFIPPEKIKKIKEMFAELINENNKLKQTLNQK